MQRNKTGKVVPYVDDKSSKSRQVERMFDEIAGKYDFLNHVFSWGIDKQWRRQGIDALRSLSPKRILDVATGTGDLAVEACRRLCPDEIVGIDISEQMMSIGREKVASMGMSDVIRFERQNCEDLSFADNSFDAAMSAFGVRNFENLDGCLKEIIRVLRPGGRFMILELSTPENALLKLGYRFYSKLIPLIGRATSRNDAAYSYLPQSISAFPQNAELQRIMEVNGFRNVSYKKLLLEVCTMYSGEKQA
ncbi:MAG: bifunctional demethylmenaquinone methyltransferase/2-methoxy-6-polyprenyl-1,4-benzoquinol methylase UbiE [Culturomica sp.]|jgi:demethylmenaquinone methyltransferase/2-methoxy-6-polyprenyl-1,4-benzoquinol methylase|nr:bifunctional demethylmenaquinone methyltransferase/2-methoxy-6-polyprenyl-1,4-benzoquinol methylase UbiE [Culturomica sp.]